jgi:thiol-disulfide isomerase/thioredoxin
MTVIVTLYHADWCGACLNYKPKWEELKEKFKGNDDVIFRDFVHCRDIEKHDEHDCNKSKKIAEKDTIIVNEADINSFPTLKISVTGKEEDVPDRSKLEELINEKLKVENKNSDKLDNSESQEQKGGGYIDYLKKYQKYKLKYMKLKQL